MKASQCGNERQEDLAGGKRVVRKGRKNLLFWFDIDWIKEIIFSFAVWDKTAYVEMDAT